VKALPATVAALAVLLVGSNAWWAYQSLDGGVTQMYMRASLNDNAQALAQTLPYCPWSRVLESRSPRSSLPRG
jgi:hypothetical protein